MANTLRRKMFKLGGEVNTHGVGITSGLEYRRPGYNAGGQVIKPGPDGQPRQHARFGGIMALAEAAQNAIKLKNPLTPVINYIRFGGKNVGRASKPGAGKGEIYGGTVGKGLSRKEFLDKYPNLGGITGSLGRLRQAGRAANVAGLSSMPFATASLLAGPRMTPDERKTATDFQKGLDTSRGVVEALPAFSGLGLGAEVAGNIGDAVYESTKQDPNYSIQSLPELFRKMAGSSTPTEETISDKKPGSDFVPTSDVMEMAQTQEEQFAKMQADADKRAEMYYAMLGGGGPDKVRALGDAFTAAGAMYDEDKSQALAGFKGGIDAELDRDEALRDESRRLAINDIVTEDATTKQDLKAREQMVEQAKLAIMTSPDMSAEQRSSTIVALEAFGQGIINLLPTNDKEDDMDRTGMKPGTVYLDITGITDGTYVAVNSDKDDPNQIDSFNSIPEAKAHAAS